MGVEKVGFREGKQLASAGKLRFKTRSVLTFKPEAPVYSPCYSPKGNTTGQGKKKQAGSASEVSTAAFCPWVQGLDPFDKAGELVTDS